MTMHVAWVSPMENHPVNKGDPWILPGDWQASWLEQGWDTAIRPVVILGGWMWINPPMTRFTSLCLDPIPVNGTGQETLFFPMVSFKPHAMQVMFEK